MTFALASLICLLIVGTSFLSGLFGMAGGLVLVGVLLLLLPVPTAMVLHAVTQMASNGWRAFLWREHVQWAPVAAYVVGCLIALAIWSAILFVPDKATAIIFLGLTPFLARLIPSNRQPDPENRLHALVYGIGCMSLMLLTGVAGPPLDAFFLGGRLNRKQIVATKGMCQVFGHGLKMIYFGGIIASAGAGVVSPGVMAAAIAAAMIGTMLAKQLLERMTDSQYRAWANGLITVIGSYYLCYGSYLLIARHAV